MVFTSITDEVETGNILQATLGDYILTPEICVERRRLSDLISSFDSARL